MEKLNIFVVTIMNSEGTKQHFVLSESKNLTQTFLIKVLGLKEREKYFLKKLNSSDFYKDVTTVEGYKAANEFLNIKP